MKISYRLVDILLRYLSFVSFDWGAGTSAHFSQICNFLNRFQLEWLKMTHNGQFCHRSGLDWLKMANFGQFSTFPRFSPKKWLILTWNGQFHPIHNFPIFFHQIGSILAKSQNFGGGTLAKFSQICNFFNCLQPQWLKMTHNGQFCHRSGLDWLKMANLCQFSTFPRFSPKKQLRLTWLISPNSQLFQSFPTKAAHFWPNLKIFHLGGTSNFGHVKSAISKEAIGLITQLSM